MNYPWNGDGPIVYDGSDGMASSGFSSTIALPFPP